ncbi:MAG TPA: NAD(P)-dependent oxidoreductase [Dermatophilaceae bacterium]|nr:NAD(P)-dependent oxidoreductase [Dermatophilaceae bacterium]
MSPIDLRVGWIGTGRMGFALAQRLSRAGVDVAAWNRTRAKAEPLAEFGVTVVDVPSDLADRDVVFTMVSTSGDLDQVLDQLLADPDRAPRHVVDCSTVSSEASASTRQRLAKRDVSFIAAPVSGNGKVVRAGMLSLVCSGPADSYAEVLPILELLGRHVTYVGDGEHARLVKICHNLLLGVVTQNLAEITVLAEKGGVPRSAFLDFINNSVMGSVFTRYKTPAFVNLDYSPTFTPVLLRKDFDLGLAVARELDVPMPLAAITAQLVQASVSSGRITEDFAVLLDLQAASSGLELEAEGVEVDDGLGGEESS